MERFQGSGDLVSLGPEAETEAAEVESRAIAVELVHGRVPALSGCFHGTSPESILMALLVALPKPLASHSR